MNRCGILLFRQLPRSGSLYAKASFSTTSPAQLDLSNLYSKLTGWRRKSPANQVVDPTKSKDSERSDDSMPVDSKPRKLTILGEPKNIDEEWPSVREFAEFTPWPTNHHKQDLTAQEINEAVSAVEHIDFSTIQARFDAVKQVTSVLKVAIPDPVLNSLSSAEDLKSHLMQSARPFDERQPDAIYLNAEDFAGTNITISDPVAERKAQKQKLQQLVKDAKEAQERNADELMRSG